MARTCTLKGNPQNLDGPELKVGDKAPDFTLPNVRGESVSLSDILAKGPAVVAFYRGAW